MPSEEVPIKDDSHSSPEMADVSGRVRPINCARCDTNLSCEGDGGTCPNCGTAFDRRERILETYGPEALVDPGEGEHVRPASSWAPYRRAIIFSGVALLSIPVAQYFVRTGAVGADRMPFVLFLFVIALFEWFRAVREEEPPESDDEP